MEKNTKKDILLGIAFVLFLASWAWLETALAGLERVSQ